VPYRLPWYSVPSVLASYSVQQPLDLVAYESTRRFIFIDLPMRHCEKAFLIIGHFHVLPVSSPLDNQFTHTTLSFD
jgi:hypothetical protein